MTQISIMNVLLLVILTKLHVSNAQLIYNLEEQVDVNRNGLKERSNLIDNLGTPLILTDFLKNGKINEARKASLVSPLIGDIVSYSGFFTVDERYNSNLFFWYFPAEESPDTAPVVLWLQGGPGGTSLYGLFIENGPYNLDNTGKIKLRDIYWTKTMNVIYIDNPVRTGFSFTDSEEGLSRNETSVASNLYEALQQFFTMFPKLRKNDFFLTGESYAGKYIPALGYTIHRNKLAKNKINLKGLAIGDGLVDPINQLGYGNFLLGIGLIDEKQKALFDQLEKIIESRIISEDWISAHDAFNYLLTNLIRNTTGFSYFYNYLINNGEEFKLSLERLDDFLTSPDIRRKIHVGNQNFNVMSREVYAAMGLDFMQSVAPWLATLADNYKVLLYNGQLDIIVAYPLTLNYLNKLSWCGAAELASADRTRWYVGEELGGYIKTSAPSHCNGSVSLVMVRNAGHTVPLDQPLWAYSLISSFINNII